MRIKTGDLRLTIGNLEHMNDLTPEERDAPIYSTFSELTKRLLSRHGHGFLSSVHIAAVALGIWAVVAAPQDWAYIAGIWGITQFVLGSLSTTLYSHRLITHNATRQVSLPVHLFFCVFGQILSVQGSVRRWSANHVLHHGVDRHGKKELDPYSATWFPDSLRNFLWSHTLTHLFNHPESEEYQRAHNAKRHAGSCGKTSTMAYSQHFGCSCFPWDWDMP